MDNVRKQSAIFFAVSRNDQELVKAASEAHSVNICVPIYIYTHLRHMTCGVQCPES